MWSAIKRWWQTHKARRKPWTEHRYIALDIETSGLDPTNDQILAIAWVEVSPPVIHYTTGRYYLIKHDKTDLKQSPVIHGLVKKDFIETSELCDVMKALAAELNNKILICHHIQLDWRFLKQAAKHCDIQLSPLALFDTLAFEASRLKRQQHHIQRGSLTLSACRTRYGLPEYDSHHAFSDAVGCAELMLAQGYKFAGSSKSSIF
ncbi:MAG: DNA polymerase III subunit epsilon [Idiomarina sp.]|nr:MAG: DNA polymerase III subunit epsilon [Idiomarina sp.]